MHSAPTFSDLNLNTPLLNALEDLGLQRPTSIQQKAFAVILSGQDVLGIAQTGTGKTFAYLLPLLRQWKYSKEKHPGMLVVVPTRELVDQVSEAAQSLAKYMNIRIRGVYGGTNIRTQMVDLMDGMDLLVATPGRLLDLVLNGAVKLKQVRKLVIDEVDEMLNLGFRSQLGSLLDLLGERRQNLLFSATLTEEVEALIEDFFRDPVRIEAAPAGSPLENIDQSLYLVANFNTKLSLLEYLLADADEFNKVLVFAATKQLADQLYTDLAAEYPGQVGVIHSNKDQNNRFQTVNHFQEGTYRILIATDIIARGLDIAGVSHVINFDTPELAEHYIHRIGRTGRADRKGKAITFVRPPEKESLEAIEALMQYSIPVLAWPEEVPISTVLTEDELPRVRMKEIPVTIIPRDEKNAAFHEKSEKNKKTNQKVRHVDKMKIKYGKPKTRGQKRTKK